MKNFTLLIVILFIASIANAQEFQGIQYKVKKMQETMSRFSIQTEGKFPRTKSGGRNGLIKNTSALHTLDSVIYQEYIQQNETWRNLWKDEYHYDSELKNTSQVENEWDIISGTWAETGKVELDYTEDGKVNALNIYTPDETTGEFIFLNRTVAYYNPEGRLDSALHYSYVTDPVMNWNIEGKEIYRYNETGQLERIEITSLEEDEEGVYYLLMAIIINYHYTGRIATYSMYIIDSEEGYLFSEITYNYDDSGRLLASEISSMDFFTMEIGPETRTDYEYNAAGDMVVETLSTWDSTTEDWNVEQKSEYTYSNISFSEVALPTNIGFWGVYDESDRFTHAFTEIVTSTYLDGEWSISERNLFYYSEGTTTGTGDYQEAAVLVYPNPASDNITVQWDGYGPLSLELYHITGAKIIEKQVSSGMNIQVSNLNNGLYLLKLLHNNQLIYSGKLLKR